jgi:RimJ/RimL family protein N-acetyltransferase
VRLSELSRPAEAVQTPSVEVIDAAGRGSLLDAMRRRLQAAGYARVELSVYVDNRRAVAWYDRLGWRRRGAPAAHPGTGKPEQRYELRL